MRRLRPWLAVIALTAVAALASEPALAGNYNGYGETGFVHDRKRDCCDDAIALAGEDSALACERSGGVPDYDPRRLRGSCDTDWRQDSSGHLLYSCRASATVRCR